MHIALIAVLDENGLIGADNAMPWHLPADLARFKRITEGKPVLMGRRTHASIGRPLPGRTNLVVTRRSDYAAPGCEVFCDIDSAIASVADTPELMVIGGAEIYSALLPRATRMYLTRIHHRFSGDTWFPRWDADAWQEVERIDVPADARNAYATTFVSLERRHAHA